LGGSPPGFLKGDALARIQLTRSLFGLAQQFRIIVMQIGFLLNVNPFEKGQSRFLWELNDGLLNLLHGAHNANLS